MTNLRSEFGILKGRAEENQVKNNQLCSKYSIREPHNIQEGIRKDKKIKMNRKSK